MEELLKNVDTKYHLITLAGIRANALLAKGEGNIKASEAIDRALEDIVAGKIRVKPGGSAEGKGENKKRKS